MITCELDKPPKWTQHSHPVSFTLSHSMMDAIPISSHTLSLANKPQAKEINKQTNIDINNSQQDRQLILTQPSHDLQQTLPSLSSSLVHSITSKVVGADLDANKVITPYTHFYLDTDDQTDRNCKHHRYHPHNINNKSTKDNSSCNTTHCDYNRVLPISFYTSFTFFNSRRPVYNLNRSTNNGSYSISKVQRG